MVLKVGYEVHRVGQILGWFPTSIVCRVPSPFDQVLGLSAKGSLVKDGFNFILRFSIQDGGWWWWFDSVGKDIRVGWMVSCEEGYMEDRVYLEGCRQVKFVGDI